MTRQMNRVSLFVHVNLNRMSQLKVIWVCVLSMMAGGFVVHKIMNPEQVSCLPSPMLMTQYIDDILEARKEDIKRIQEERKRIREAQQRVLDDDDQ